MVTKPLLNINTYAKEVYFDEIREKTDSELSLRTIEEAICVLSPAMPCFGQKIASEVEKQFLN